FEKGKRVFRRCPGIDGSLKKTPCLFRVAAMKSGDAGLQELLRLALALGERASRPFDVRPGTGMAAIQKQRPRPDVDRLFVLAGEIMVETPEEELFDLRITIGILRAIERARPVGTKRIGHRQRRSERSITLVIAECRLQR